MDNQSDKKTIKETILAKIKDGNIKKLPKSFFVLQSILFATMVMVILALLLFIVSFLFFTLQVSGLWHLSEFGLKGIELLFGNLPWLLILITILFIIVLEMITRRYRFVYQRPLFYSALVIIFVVVVASFLVRQSSLHERIYRGVENGRLPVMKYFYDEYTNPNPDNFHPGTVSEMTSTGFMLEGRDKVSIGVVVTENTQIRPNLKIHKGGRLLVVGKIKGGAIEADLVDNAPLSGRP